MNRLAEAMHKPPRIRAACLWGDALEHRIDFDAAYWFQEWSDDDILSHFETTVRVPLPDGDSVIRFEDEHPEWGRIELVTEIIEVHPDFAPMLAWLSQKNVAVFSDADDDLAESVTEFIAVYLSREDALRWLHANRPDLYADLKSSYELPAMEARYFKRQGDVEP